MDLDVRHRNEAVLEHYRSENKGVLRDAGSASTPKKNSLTFRHVMAVFIVLAGTTMAGCVSEPKRTYSDEFVKNFVDLTMLYERSKMEQKMTDSTYKVSVEKFFRERGVDQAEFKKQVDVLSTNAEVWKLFIGDVTKRIDSLKQAEYDSNAE